MNGERRALVTGATGYVGGRLVPGLISAGWNVTVLARRPDKLREAPWADSVRIVEGDARSSADIAVALEGVDVAYYLLHSLHQGKGLEDAEERTAEAFAAAAGSSSLQRIIYLGGLAPQLGYRDPAGAKDAPHSHA